jgi:hypothetical protein
MRNAKYCTPFCIIDRTKWYALRTEKINTGANSGFAEFGFSA